MFIEFIKTKGFVYTKNKKNATFKILVLMLRFLYRTPLQPPLRARLSFIIINERITSSLRGIEELFTF
ncbi:MAG: hypothetical protein ACJA1Z_001030 [Patiriisocius sp.]|jgi:hypothetical protein